MIIEKLEIIECKDFQNLFDNTKEINILSRNKIRELRDEQGLLQRQQSVILEINTPMFSKIEAW